MKNQLLLPTYWKKIGWIILIPTSLMGLYILFIDSEFVILNLPVFAIRYDFIFGQSGWFSIIETDVFQSILSILFILGALLVSFSREKKEDEFINQLRLNAWKWAVLVNYILLLLAFVFVYGLSFMHVMLFNMFTVLIIYIVRFQWVLYRYSKDN